MLYHRPRTVPDALAFLAEGPARVAAGCTDLFPATALPELAGPIIDLTAVEGLRGISQTPEHWRFGATTTWADVIRADLPPAFDGLKLAAREVGSVQIQNAGTIAGNLCNASPAADGVPPLLTLDADIELTSVSGTRLLPLAEFIIGPRQIALRRGEIVSAVLVPKTAGEGASTFLKLGARKYLVISIAMVAARLTVRESVIETAAIAVGACSAVAVRLPSVEAALEGQSVDARFDALITDESVADHLSPIADARADAAYRGHTAAELVRRAIAALAGESQEALA